MNVLVTGAFGQLGRDLVPLLKTETNYDVFTPHRSELDLSNKDSIIDYLSKYSFDIIIHAGAYTQVDQAEDEADLCFLVNVESTRLLVDYANEKNAYLVFISSDYVFDGTHSTPYQPYDLKNPLSIYGKSKAIAEEIVIPHDSIVNATENHLIIRTSWVYGNKGPNFVLTMIRLLNEKKEIRVIDDQLGSPTYTHDLGIAIKEAIEMRVKGIIHLTGSDVTTWYGFAATIKEMIQASCKIHPVSSEAFKTKAIRPKNSRLSKSHLNLWGLKSLPTWKDGLKRYLKEIKENEL